MSETAAVNQGPDEPRTPRLVNVADARRVAIATARRIIARDGAGRLTLDGVGHEAGLPIGALASHFDNEQELLMAVAADDLGGIAKAMRASNGAAQPLNELVQRVELLETAFTSMIDRHQKSLRNRNDLTSWVEQCVKDLQQQVDLSDRAFAQMRSEIRAALPPLTVSASVSAPVVMPAPAAVADAPLPANVARLIVEPPPVDALPPAPPAPNFEFADIESTSFETSSPASMADLPPLLSPQEEKPDTSHSEEAVLMDNYLLDARRAAIATQAGNDRERHEAKRRSNRTRVLAVAFLGPIAILATAVMVLNRNVVTATPATQASMPIDLPIAEAAPTPAPKLVSVAPGNEVPPPAPVAKVEAPQVNAAAPTTPAPTQVANAAPLENLTALATKGDSKAERDLGLKYLSGDGVQADESQAARWLMRAAYRGEPTAEYWLGTLYARGHGVPEDAFQANHWYEAAAQKGNRRAMHSFAVAYFQGWGVEKNYAEAARWFRSAADLGFVDSQFNLAVLYERGAGIQQSLTEAYKWYAIAAKGGDKEADTRVAVLATQLAPADLALAQQAAASFKPQPMDESANLAGGPQSTDG
jgi:localization factor PodJL